jgi:hypothetical protein
MSLKSAGYLKETFWLELFPFMLGRGTPLEVSADGKYQAGLATRRDKEVY